MLDYHLAELEQVETRALKQAVKRNIERFPSDFMFVLTKEEANLLLSIGVSQNVIPPDYRPLPDGVSDLSDGNNIVIGRDTGRNFDYYG